MGHDEGGNCAWFHRRHSALGHCGECVGGRRIDENQAGDIAALPGSKHAHVRAAEGMAGGNERAFLASSPEQSIKFATDGFGVSRRLRRIAPGVSGPVIGTDPRHCRDLALNPCPVQRAATPPSSKITVGVPAPVQLRWSWCPSTSMSRPGGGRSANLESARAGSPRKKLSTQDVDTRNKPVQPMLHVAVAFPLSETKRADQRGAEIRGRGAGLTLNLMTTD
jgi:hypothetical protein